MMRRRVALSLRTGRGFFDARHWKRCDVFGFIRRLDYRWSQLFS